MSTYPKFYFRPARGEQINTVIGPNDDSAAAICGRVIDGRGRPVEGALVLLFLTTENEAPELISRFTTDDDGHFLFGPLPPEQLYLIKVFKSDNKLRQLEIVTD